MPICHHDEVQGALGRVVRTHLGWTQPAAAHLVQILMVFALFFFLAGSITRFLQLSSYLPTTASSYHLVGGRPLTSCLNVN